jgi:hypothetical protein
MRKIKILTAIMVMAMVMSMAAPQAFAGDISCGLTGEIPNPPGITGPQESPGAAGDIGMPGLNGDMGTPPGLNGEMGSPGFLDGWMGTPLAAIASLFG